MALILDFSETYTWPVAFEYPVSGGKYRRVTFEAEFLRMEQEDIEPMLDVVNKAEGVDQVRELRNLASQVLVGWGEVKDKNGEDVPYSETAKAKLLNIASLASVIVETYSESIAKERGKH